MQNKDAKAGLGAAIAVGLVVLPSLMGMAYAPQPAMDAAGETSGETSIAYRDAEFASFDPAFAWAENTALAVRTIIGAVSQD